MPLVEPFYYIAHFSLEEHPGAREQLLSLPGCRSEDLGGLVIDIGSQAHIRAGLWGLTGLTGIWASPTDV